MNVNEVVSSGGLAKRFDGYWQQVIGNRLERIPSERTENGRRKPAKYRIVEKLPTPEQYRELKIKAFTSPIADLVSEAFGEIESLQDEMQSWYDNLSDGLQQTEKAERIQEAADALANLDQVDVPDEFSKLIAVYFPSLKNDSRADRASEAAERLRTAVCVAREFVEEAEDGDDLDVDWIDEIENVADELDSVEFPGMYG